MNGAALATALAELGHGTYLPTAGGGTIYVGARPPAPVNVVVVAPSGAGPEPSLWDEYETTRWQIWVRDATFTGGEVRAAAVYASLHGRRSWTASGTLVVVSWAVSTPGWVGIDDDGRHNWTLNVNFHIANPARIP